MELPVQVRSNGKLISRLLDVKLIICQDAAGLSALTLNETNQNASPLWDKNSEEPAQPGRSAGNFRFQV
jgi:hypothetical protein